MMPQHISNEEAIRESQFRITHLEAAAEQLQKQLQAERHAVLTMDPKVLEDEIRHMDSEIAERKDRIQSKKREIRDLKQSAGTLEKNYHALADDVKKDNWSLLMITNGETSVRISRIEAEIGTLETENFALLQKKEASLQRLEVGKNVSEEGTADQDIRWIALQDELQEEKEKLASLKQRDNRG